MRSLCLLLLVLIGLTAGPGSALAHSGPCPELAVPAAAMLVAAVDEDLGHGCGSGRADCHMPDCCQAGAAVDVAAAYAMVRPSPRAPAVERTIPSRWAEPLRRLYRPPLLG